jgi:Zn-finger nucleic acid-binding protein
MAEEREAFIRFGGGEPGSARSAGERKRAYIPCPECGKLMNHKSFSRGFRVILDSCRSHGTWLDRRELQQIFSYIRSGGLQRSRERERRDLEEEKARLKLKQFELEARANRMSSCGNSTPSLDRSGDSVLEFLTETLFK